MSRLQFAAAVSALALAGAAFAAPVTVYSADFEALTAGSALTGQGSPVWLTTGDATNSGAGTVQAGLGVGGTKAFRVNTDPMTTTTFWWQEPGNVALAGKSVRLQYDFDLNPPLVSTSTAKSSWSVGIYNPAGSRISGIGISSTGLLTYVNAAGTATTYTLPVPVTAAQGFNRLGLTLDFSLAIPTGTVDFNGAVLPITAGVVVANGTIMGDVDIVASPSGFDVGVFDNILLTTDVVVPEPTAIAGIACASLTLLRRRRA